MNKINTLWSIAILTIIKINSLIIPLNTTGKFFDKKEIKTISDKKTNVISIAQTSKDFSLEAGTQKNLENSEATYIYKGGYLLQIQHLASTCLNLLAIPKQTKIDDVVWVNGIKVGKTTPYIVDSNGNSMDANLDHCQSAKVGLKVTLTAPSLGTIEIAQPHCQVISTYANGFQCVDNPYAYSDFSGVTSFVFDSYEACVGNHSPVGFTTHVNDMCSHSQKISCDVNKKTVTTIVYQESTCITLISNTTVSFADFQMNTCDTNAATGFAKYRCITRGNNPYVIPPTIKPISSP